MKINIGDYVRTKYGEICKLYKSEIKGLLFSTDIEIDRCNDRDCNDYGFDSITIKDIIKSSPNIIDLIEVGDYVNGRKVYQIGYNAYDDFVLKMSESNYEDFIYQQNIKSIVTKEQFSQIEYKIGDDK